MNDRVDEPSPKQIVNRLLSRVDAACAIRDYYCTALIRARSISPSHQQSRAKMGIVSEYEGAIYATRRAVSRNVSFTLEPACRSAYALPKLYCCPWEGCPDRVY